MTGTPMARGRPAGEEEAERGDHHERRIQKITASPVEVIATLRSMPSAR